MRAEVRGGGGGAVGGAGMGLPSASVTSIVSREAELLVQSLTSDPKSAARVFYCDRCINAAASWK